jgi:GNAT superfamily N-acetyltransferase
MPEPFGIRPATADDAQILARHRAAMFRDMGELPDQLWDELVEASATSLEQTLLSGEYHGWLASPPEHPAEIVASAGVLLRPMIPRPDAGSGTLLFGPQALILNVYTEPPWRRRGLAALLMRHIMDWAEARGIRVLVLQASDDGRLLYEKLGFRPTHEMQYLGPRR